MEITSPPVESPFLPDSLLIPTTDPLQQVNSNVQSLSYADSDNIGDAFTASQADLTGLTILTSGAVNQADGLFKLPPLPSDSGSDTLTGQKTHGVLSEDASGDGLIQASLQAKGKKNPPITVKENGEKYKGTKGDDRFIVSKSTKNTTLIGKKGDDKFDITKGKGGHTLKGGPGDDTFVVAKKRKVSANPSTIIGFKAGKDTVQLKNWKAGDLDLVQAGKDTLVKTQTGKTIVKLKKFSSDKLTSDDFKGADLAAPLPPPPPPPPPPSALPSISITANNGGTVSERDAGETADATFTVTLSKASSQPVTVNYQTVAGSATPGDNDYTPVNNTLTFNPGDPLSKTIQVAVIGDDELEFDETFSLKLEAPQDAMLGTSQAQMTILNEDTKIIKGNGNGADGSKTDDLELDYTFQIYTISESGQYRIDETIEPTTGVDSDPNKGIFSGAIENFTATVDKTSPEEFSIDYEGLTLDLEARFLAQGDTVLLANGNLQTVDEDRIEYVITGSALSETSAPTGQRVIEIALQTEDLAGIDTYKAVNCIDYIVEEGLFTRIDDIDSDDVRISIVESDDPPTVDVRFANSVDSEAQDTATLERAVEITDPNDIPPSPPECHDASSV